MTQVKQFLPRYTQVTSKAECNEVHALPRQAESSERLWKGTLRLAAAQKMPTHSLFYGVLQMFQELWLLQIRM